MNCDEKEIERKIIIKNMASKLCVSLLFEPNERVLPGVLGVYEAATNLYAVITYIKSNLDKHGYEYVRLVELSDVERSEIVELFKRDIRNALEDVIYDGCYI